MNIIVAVDKNWAIGNKGDLLVRIKADHRRFKALTVGKVVVLGRKTMDTFPGRKPLKDRTNIILSRDSEYYVEGAVVVNSVEGLLEELKKYQSEDVFIIGGSSIYEQMLPYCDCAYITKIDHEFEADAFFPNLDIKQEWKAFDEINEQDSSDYNFSFVTYRRIGVSGKTIEKGTQ